MNKMEKKELGQSYKRKSTFFKSVTPKSIIIQALKTRLSATGITRLTLVFNVHSDKYNILLSNPSGGNLKLDIEEKEMNLIKRLFVTKAYKKFCEMYDKEIASIIIEINLEVEDDDAIRLFTQDEGNNVELFDYKF